MCPTCPPRNRFRLPPVREIAPNHLEELARSRADRVISDTPASVGCLSSEQQRFKLQARSQSAKLPAVEKVKKEQETNDKVKKPKTPWAPRKEFLARHEAGRKRAQTPARPANRSRSPSKRRERTPAKRSKKRSPVVPP